MRLSIATVVILTAWFASAPLTEPSELRLPDGDASLIRQTRDLRLNVDYLKGYASDARSIFTSPFSFQPSGWLKFSFITVITTAVANEEDDIQNWVQENRNASSDRIAGFVKPFGDGKYTLPTLAGLYCYGHFFQSERARRTALIGLESFVFTGILTETIKRTSHKHRPRSEDLEGVRWDGPRFSNANLSFPSGHTSSAFAVATVVASEYGDNAFVPPLMYGAATLCAFSRINDNAHWASDVIMGAAIGHFVAKEIIVLHGGKTDKKFSLLPVATDGRPGLSILYRF